MSVSRDSDADGEVWRSFKQLLASPATITLPPETLYGAISHFLATRPLDTLPEVINTILSSKSLWATGPQGHEVRDAVRLAVSSKRQAVRQSLTKAYFPAYRERKQLQQWLSAVGARLVDADNTGERAQILLGLVEGMKDTPDAEWGIMLDTLEDELVVAVAGFGEASALSTSQLDFLCAAIVVVEEARLEVLNVEVSSSYQAVFTAHARRRSLLSSKFTRRKWRTDYNKICYQDSAHPVLAPIRALRAALEPLDDSCTCWMRAKPRPASPRGI